MRFSVLIPVYNTEKYLDQCIRSVLDQTFHDFEIIIVDDGSTDNSLRLCDDFRNKYPDKIRVIHQENHGLISARRTGIAYAYGDYCVFVDSDDYVKPSFLAQVNSALPPDDSIDILLYSYLSVSEGQPDTPFHQIAENGKVWAEENKRELYEKLIFTNDITPMWIKAVKTSLLRSDPTGYSVYYHKNMAEDLLQSLFLMTEAKKIKYIFEPLYCYRYNDNSISRKYTPASVKKMDTIHVYQKIREYLPAWGMDDDFGRRKLDARWFNNTMYLFCRCYDAADFGHRISAVKSVDWDSMIPNRDTASYAEFANDYYLKVYRYFHEKRFGSLKFCIWKNHLYRKYKTIKRKAMDQRGNR